MGQSQLPPPPHEEATMWETRGSLPTRAPSPADVDPAECSAAQQLAPEPSEQTPAAAAAADAASASAPEDVSADAATPLRPTSELLFRQPPALFTGYPLVRRSHSTWRQLR